jgi:hypothetical protein
LKSLKDYLQDVTSSTLCIEEHLYDNISAIHFSSMSKNTIPEALCFAFDFVERPAHPIKGAWELFFADDAKVF